MNTHEQLATLTTALEADGWVRLNGNTWRKGQWTLRTAYAHQEATLRFGHDHKPVHTLLGPEREAGQGRYRGSEPLTWAETEAPWLLRKILRKALAKRLDKLVKLE